MPDWMIFLLVAGLVVVLTPVLIVHMKRSPRRGGGGLGAGFGALEEAFDPSRRHVVEARDVRPRERRAGEPPET